MQIRKSIRSFKPAIKGILESIREGNNIKIHLVAALCAIILSIYLHISALDWCIILLCIGLVISAELCNTSIEMIVDKITSKQEEWARRTKDTAAGAVLILAALAFIVGMIIWYPYILKLIE